MAIEVCPILVDLGSPFANAIGTRWQGALYEITLLYNVIIVRQEYYNCAGMAAAIETFEERQVHPHSSITYVHMGFT